MHVRKIINQRYYLDNTILFWRFWHLFCWATTVVGGILIHSSIFIDKYQEKYFPLGEGIWGDGKKLNWKYKNNKNKQEK